MSTGTNTKNSFPSSEHEAKDRCPSCGSFCNIFKDLDDNDECNDCRKEEKTIITDNQSSLEWFAEQILLKHPIITQFLPNWNFDKSIVEQAKAMHEKEVDAKIQKAIEKFEEAKNKASTLRDVMYLDGVLAILDTIKNENI